MSRKSVVFKDGERAGNSPLEIADNWRTLESYIHQNYRHSEACFSSAMTRTYLQRPLCPFQWQGQLQGKTRSHGTTDQANHRTAGRMSSQLGNRHAEPEWGLASVVGWELGSSQPGPATSTGCHTLSSHIFHPRWSRGSCSRICIWACRAHCW